MVTTTPENHYHTENIQKYFMEIPVHTLKLDWSDYIDYTLKEENIVCLIANTLRRTK